MVGYNLSSEDFCEEKTTTRNLLFQLLCIYMLIIGVVGNALCIIVIVGSRQLRAVTGYHFLVSLAVAELGVLFFVTSFKIDYFGHNLRYCHSIEFCVFSSFTDFLFPIASAFHMTVIAVDRFIAITMPFFYCVHFTKKKVRVYILFVWLWCVLWASLGMFSWQKGKFIFTVIQYECHNPNKYYVPVMLITILLLPFVISFWCYMHILKVVRSTTQHKNNLQLHRRKFPRKELKAVKTVFIAFVAFGICYVPHSMFTVLGYWTNVINAFSTAYPSAHKVLLTVFYDILPLLNTCVNPFLYFLAGSHFRKASKEIYFKIMKKPHSSFNLQRNENGGLSGSEFESNKTFKKKIRGIYYKLSKKEKTFSLENSIQSTEIGDLQQWKYISKSRITVEEILETNSFLDSKK